MRSSVVAIAAAIALAGVVVSCIKPGTSPARPLVDNSAINAAIAKASSGLAIRTLGGGGGAHGSPVGHVVEYDARFECDQGTRHRFAAALRLSTEELLLARGASILGRNQLGNDHALDGFAWEYASGRSFGFLRAYVFGTAPQARVVILCYEHD